MLEAQRRNRLFTSILAFALGVVFSSEIHAITIRGFAWSAHGAPGCGDGQDPGGDRLADIEIGLFDENGDPLQVLGEPLTTRTASDGSYVFTGLGPAFDWQRWVFEVRMLTYIEGMEVGAINCLNTRLAEGCVLTEVSNLVPCGDVDLDKRTIFVDLNAYRGRPELVCETVVTGVDFVFCDCTPALCPCSGIISGEVWIDTSGEGTRDADERGLGNIEVTLRYVTGYRMARKITSGDGAFRFAELCAGDYTLEVEAPEGTEPTIVSADSLESLSVVTLVSDSGVTSNQDLGFRPTGSLVRPHLFLPGDCNGDDRVDLSDATFTFLYLLRGGDTPVCWKACDPNFDRSVDLSDAIFALNFLFRAGLPPLRAYPECDSALNCLQDTCES